MRLFWKLPSGRLGVGRKDPAAITIYGDGYGAYGPGRFMADMILDEIPDVREEIENTIDTARSED